MQYKIYRAQEEACRAIVFFNGWAMTPESVEHLALPEGYDLIVLWDYRDLTLPEELALDKYQDIILVAWSMGVWAADVALAESLLPIRRAVAVCGTGYPMDDAYGIPEAVFRGTLEGLTEDNRMRFNRRMCGGRTYKTLFEALAKRETEEIREELTCVLAQEEQRCERAVPKPRQAPWTDALVGLEDRIIPADNQVRYWRASGVRARLLDKVAHYAFGAYTQWTDLWEEAYARR